MPGTARSSHGELLGTRKVLLRSFCARDRRDSAGGHERARYQLVRVTTETRHLGRLCQQSEFDQESSTALHSARSKAQVAQQPMAEPDGKAPQSKEQSTQQTNRTATKLKHRRDKAAGFYTSRALYTSPPPRQSGRLPHITGPVHITTAQTRRSASTHHGPCTHHHRPDKAVGFYTSQALHTSQAVYTAPAIYYTSQGCRVFVVPHITGK